MYKDKDGGLEGGYIRIRMEGGCIRKRMEGGCIKGVPEQTLWLK